MKSKSFLLFSLPIILILSNTSIAKESSELAIWEAQSELELAAWEADVVADAQQAAAEAEAAAEADLDNSPWIYVGTSTTGMDYYLDSTSIKKESSNYDPLRYENGTLDFANSYKRAWWKTVKTNGDYSKIQTKFYCSKDVTIDIASANYDVNNNYIGSPNIKNKLDPVIPDTVFSKIAEIVCNVY